MAAPSRAIRVLHVLGSLSRGGIETWLMHVIRHTSRDSVEHDFALTGRTPGPYEDEAHALGCKIHRLSGRGGKMGWLYRLFGVLRRERYDVLHAHAHYFSGVLLPAAALAGTRSRIAHIHTVASNEHRQRFWTGPYRRAMKGSIGALKTLGLAISQNSAADFFGADWRSQRNTKLMLYGFDYSRFRGACAREGEFRAAWGVDRGAMVFGNVARFVPFKNHTFLLDVFAEILKLEPAARLVLIGSGPLESELKAKSHALGISHAVVFAGETGDAAGAMAAMNVFVLPSWTEGLGIVTVEAQAAGCRCLITDTMPVEVDISPDAIQRLPLNVGAAEWAASALKLAQMPRRDAEQALGEVLASQFGIERCVRDLEGIYRNQLGLGDAGKATVSNRMAAG